MKKWVLIAGLILLAVCYWFFIASKTPSSKTIVAHCTISAANRVFANTSRWNEWWPRNSQTVYNITGLFYNEVRLSVQYQNNGPVNSRIRLAPLNGDSILVDWENTGKLPSADIDTVLESFKSFVEDARKIYGADFHTTLSTDSTLVTLNNLATAYPATNEIYLMIDSIREYIAGQGAEVINYPMLNVQKTGGGQYKILVALSVNKRLRGKGRISVKNFVPWRMIEGYVTGGVYNAEKAFGQLENYKNDHNLTIMALPFQSLVTDRRKEQDTTKWITNICAPIS